MAIITLTDRISVRVTAKDSTESSDQKKRDGGNVASALGGSGLSDSEKEELGDDLGDTITGEDGKTYARSDKIAGVLKKLKDEGKLSQPEEVHEGITGHDGTIYNLSAVYYAANVTLYHTPERAGSPIVNDKRTVFQDNNGHDGDFYIAFLSDTSYGNAIFFSKDPFVAWMKTQTYKQLSDESFVWQQGGGTGTTQDSPTNVTINDETYPIYYWQLGISSKAPQIVANGYEVITPLNNRNSRILDAVGYLYGSISSSGGAKVDPTGKTDDQIKRELEQAAATNGTFQNIGTDTYIAVTDENGNAMYFLGT